MNKIEEIVATIVHLRDQRKSQGTYTVEITVSGNGFNRIEVE